MAHSTADHRINKSASVSAGIGGSVQVQVSGGDDVARAEAGGDPREHPARVVPLEERPLEAVRVERAVAVEPRGGQGVAELLGAHRRRSRGGRVVMREEMEGWGCKFARAQSWPAAGSGGRKGMK